MTGNKEDGARPRHQHRPAGGSVAFGSLNPTTITDARSGASQELATRQRRYAITMAFRTACFIAMVFTPGVLRWILFAAAVVLPYVAVLFANQARRPAPGQPVSGGDAGYAPAITTGPEQGEIITGDVDEENRDGDRPGAYGNARGNSADAGDRDDRVA
ncbi:MAG: DUF3099 domain-containing protein [Microlunatus sp.]|nr:DUF3099 domain-containing protein [Microlunatus sp.]MDN5769959.1 DUF3099 domain-containing protein [Microlunatus sp.]MDN5803690.1 DUF3099 domain-containing protein [Microlunatus sp.]